MRQVSPSRSDQAVLLTPAEMGRADQSAIAGGVPSLDLMENAGRAVAEAALGLCASGPSHVLCGPGNNGGDGFVAARLMQERGCEVVVYLLGDAGALKGDAAINCARYEGEVQPLASWVPADSGIIIDALFGAGLARDLDGDALTAVQRANESGLPIVAVDVPSGIDGTSGAVWGDAIRAARTVTFFRYKPGHVLLPGRDHCGSLSCAQIGIPDAVLGEIGAQTWRNGPDLWGNESPTLHSQSHKYDRGHAMVVAGPRHATGAARLAADAALRIGAGLVTLAGRAGAVDLMAAQVTEVMLANLDVTDLQDLLGDPRRNAWLIGPAAGVGEGTRDKVEAILCAGKPTVLDADALTSFAGKDAEKLLGLIHGNESPVILTPHEGEFARLFGAIEGSKTERARQAARMSGAVVVLKGGDTVIAAPDGRCAIEGDAPPFLATAGSGDVLAGTACGLLAQGMDGFEAAAMAVWVHGQAGKRAGLGLIAGDIAPKYRSVLQELARASLSV